MRYFASFHRVKCVTLRMHYGQMMFKKVVCHGVMLPIVARKEVIGSRLLSGNGVIVSPHNRGRQRHQIPERYTYVRSFQGQWQHTILWFYLLGRSF